MGLSTHVLDTMHGRPAAGMAVRLYRLQGEAVQLLRELTLNADGRYDGGPLLEGAAFQPGRYRLVFAVGAYFASQSPAQGRQQDAAPAPEPFLADVPIEFGVADATQHHHVPLLCSPWSYTTYRGS